MDGLVEGKVVEVKCRRARFFRWLPEYEKVQIHAYMFLTDRPECDLVQKFDGDVQTTTYVFDEEYWMGVCIDVERLWDELLALASDPKLQNALLKRL